MSDESKTPQTLELSAGGAMFYLRDERGDYIAKTCGDGVKDEANAAEIARRYNDFTALETNLARLTAERDNLKWREGQANAWEAVHAALVQTPEYKESELGMEQEDCGRDHALRTIARLSALRARVAEQDDRISWLEAQREQECQQKESALKESEMCIRETKEARARVAELEAAVDFSQGQVRSLTERVSELEQEASLELGITRRIEAQRDQAEQRNAELVAALQELVKVGGDVYRAHLRASTTLHSQLVFLSESCDKAEDLLARAESATPAKHPDTEVVDWLEQFSEVHIRTSTSSGKRIKHIEGGSGTAMHAVADSLRAAIDAARKQGGAHD